MSISCNAVRDVFVLYRDGALSPETEKEIESHLSSCCECRGFYRGMDRGYGGVNGKTPSPRRVEPPQELHFQAVAKKLRKNRVRNELIKHTAWGLCVVGGVLVTLAAYRGHVKRLSEK